MNPVPADTPARRMLEQVMDRADQVLFEGRQRVHNLREDPTAAGDLPGALQHCGELLAQDHPILFSLSVIVTPWPIGPTLYKEAYDIGREAMTNAFRHSYAAKIEAEIIYEDTGVRLRIRDDGHGIDQKILEGGRAGHWGLPGMRERAQATGAKLNIWSRSGIGTEVDLTIPAKVAYPNSSKKSFWEKIRFGPREGRE